jgi:hypothetical protein
MIKLTKELETIKRQITSPENLMKISIEMNITSEIEGNSR